LATGLRRLEFQKQDCTMGITPKNGDSVALDSLVQAIYTLAGNAAFARCSSFWYRGQCLRLFNFCDVGQNTVIFNIFQEHETMLQP
jgi:hypothetical protein